MKEALHITALPHPRNFPEKIVGIPSMHRWGEVQPGHLPRMLYSAQAVLEKDNIQSETMMIISDASDGEYGRNLPAIREKWMRDLDDKQTSEIYILTNKLQAELAADIAQKTHIRPKVVDAILNRWFYDTQRTKIDALIQGAVFSSGRTFRFLGLDDDTYVPPEMKTLTPEFLVIYRIAPDPNSYLLWVGNSPDDNAFNTRPNSLKPFFDPLGKTIYQLRRENQNLQVTEDWYDGMHIAMDGITEEPVIFHVTHGSKNVINSDNWVVIAGINTKTGLPDPRTYTVSRQELSREFHHAEGAITAYLAGPQQLFAIRKAEYEGGPTNVDSANLSWLFNEDTQFILRWFVSDPDINNDLVDGQYRSDNEFLTELLEILSTRAGREYAYLSGIDSEIEHHRAQTGYRPKDPAEQAASSLIGNIVALAALDRIVFEKDGRARLDLTDPYDVPEEKALGVFNKMKGLQDICSEKILHLHEEIRSTKDVKRRKIIPGLIKRYEEVSLSLHRRLSNFHFPAFHRILNKEVNEQLAFSNEVLVAYPKVIEAVGKRLAKGKYKALRYVPPRERGMNYPLPK